RSKTHCGGSRLPNKNLRRPCSPIIGSTEEYTLFGTCSVLNVSPPEEPQISIHVYQIRVGIVCSRTSWLIVDRIGETRRNNPRGPVGRSNNIRVGMGVISVGIWRMCHPIPITAPIRSEINHARIGRLTARKRYMRRDR